MFVRRKNNKSGSISVHVVDKSRGMFRTVKSFGAADNEQDIRMLEALARQYILERTGYTELFPYDSDDIEDVLSSVSDTHVQMVGPELLFGKLYDKLGYDKIENELFRHLVICRLYNPGSKLRTVEYLQQYSGIKYDAAQLYQYLDNLGLKKGQESDADDIKGLLEKISLQHTLKTVGKDIQESFFYITTLNYETTQESSLKRLGLSKNIKQSCPKIYLGFLLTGNGNLLSYHLFDKKKFSSKKLTSTLEKLSSRYGIACPTLIADEALLSKKLVGDLKNKKNRFVIKTRLKYENDDLKETISSSEFRSNCFKVFSDSGEERLLVTLTDSLAEKDAEIRALGLDKLQKKLDEGKLTKSSLNNRGYNKYLQADDSGNLSIDHAKYEADSIWDGISIYTTNTDLGPQEISDHFNRLRHIENEFTMSKTDIQIRPSYQRAARRIESHMYICFTAYNILTAMKQLLDQHATKSGNADLTIEKMREAVKTMQQLTYTMPGTSTQRTVLLKLDEEQQRIYDIMYS